MNFDHNTYITIGLFFVLFGFVCGGMGYILGTKDGHEAGYLEGSADEIFNTKGKILRAKKEGAKTVLEMFRRQGRPVSEILEDRMHRAFSEYRN